MSTATATAPQLIALAGPLDIEGSSPPDKPARFSMVAYTGAALKLAGWPHPVVVDLAGLRIPSQARPVRVGHSEKLGAGHTERIAVEGGRLVASGVISRDTAAARDVVSSSRRGFPWQASIGASADEVEFVPKGRSVVVNGRTFDGPINVARKATLNEISFVDLGADGDTSAIAATTRGVSSMSTDVENLTPPPTPAPTPIIVAPPDPVAVERERVRVIRGLFGPEHRELEARALDEGMSVVEAKALALDAIRAGRAAPVGASYGGHGGGRAIQADTRSTLAASALLMAGHEEAASRHFGERVVSGIRRPNSWYELAAMACQLEGVATGGDRHEVIRAGFSTVSLPHALGVGVNRLALDVFREQSANWRSLGRRATVRDFKPGSAVRLTTATKLLEVGEGGEIKHGTIGDEAFTFRVRTFARMLQLTRQAIVNDDLNLLDDIPRVLGSEAARTVSDLFFDAIIANVDQDGADYFSTDHGNLINAALDVEGLGEAIRVLRTRADDDGRIIGFTPVSLVVPAALEQTARALLNSITLTRDQSVDRQPNANPLSSINLALIVEPRLDADSEGDWYVFARPADSAVIVAFLDGMEGVRVEQQDAPFHTLGLAFRAYMDTGVSMGEWRAAVKSDAAPYDS